MIDKKLDKFFEVIFLIGLILSMISFAYSKWFMILFLTGLTLMVLSTIKEKPFIKKPKNIYSFIKKNKHKAYHVLLLAFGFTILIILVALNINLKLSYQINDLLSAPISTSWWVFILVGLAIGLAILFSSYKFIAAKFKLKTNKRFKAYKKLINFRFKLTLPKLPRIKIKKKFKIKKPKLRFKFNILESFKKKLVNNLLFTIFVFYVTFVIILYKRYNVYSRGYIFAIFGIAILLLIFFAITKKVKTGEKTRIIKVVSIKAKQKYETDIDSLYDLVNQKERIKVSELAKYFKVDKKLIEEWGTILENRGLIRFDYPPIGEPELCKK